MEPLGVLGAVAAVGFIGYRIGRTRRREETTPRRLRSRVTRDGRAWIAIFIALALFVAFLFALLGSADPDYYVGTIVGLLAYWILLPCWVFLDARLRGARAWAWGFMTLLTNVMGLFSYLITRPEHVASCRRCGYTLQANFVVCPYCGPEAGIACSNCASMLEIDWLYCPYCRAGVGDRRYRETRPTASSTLAKNAGAAPPTEDPAAAMRDR